MIRIAIADDHPVVREGLRRIACQGAGISVTGEVPTAAELFRLLARTAVDVVLLDVSMPGSTLVETLTELKEKHPTAKVLVLSVHPADQCAERALRAGAAGYLTKDHSPELLVDAIRRVARGERYVSGPPTERFPGFASGP